MFKTCKKIQYAYSMSTSEGAAPVSAECCVSVLINFLFMNLHNDYQTTINTKTIIKGINGCIYCTFHIFTQPTGTL